jgi:CRP/FNR family cyclic AMP-dependent transcriptional regulator
VIGRFRGEEGNRRLVAALREQRAVLDSEMLAAEIAGTAELRQYEPGDFLTEQGGTETDVFLILCGAVEVAVDGRALAVRRAGCYVGEMALIDPTARRSATLRASEQTVVAVLTEPQFTALAERFPQLWRRLALELAHRLRERSRYVTPPNAVPEIFVGCSRECLEIARVVQRELDQLALVRVWTDGVFQPSSTAAEDLLRQVARSDFAVLVVGEEDMAHVRTQGSRYLLTGGLMVCKRCGTNMVGYRNRGHDYYVCGAYRYRRGLGCGQALQVRKDDIEAAVITEVGLLFDSWADTKQLIDAVNKELRDLYQQQAAAGLEVSRELERVERELANLRQLLKRGLDDVEWANSELRQLKEEREALLAQQQQIGTAPRVPEIDAVQVEQYRRRALAVFANGTNEDRNTTAKTLVRRIEVDPDTGDVWMHVISRPPFLAVQGQKRAPASRETGDAIGMVAGACFVAMHNALAAALVRRWTLPRMGRRGR